MKSKFVQYYVEGEDEEKLINFQSPIKRKTGKQYTLLIPGSSAIQILPPSAVSHLYHTKMILYRLP